MASRAGRADPGKNGDAGPDPSAEDTQLALGRRDEPHEHPQRRLAGAVRAEEPEHPALLDGERQVGHRAVPVAVGLAEAPDGERHVGERGVGRFGATSAPYGDDGRHAPDDEPAEQRERPRDEGPQPAADRRRVEDGHREHPVPRERDR